jgi:hydroxyacylglutathione hydrolase
MYFEQFYLGCLSHASYLLGSDGVGVVVDPQRDVDIYIEAAAKHGLEIKHIFETHLHADFVSGHHELATRTGGNVYLSHEARAKFSHVAVSDGFELTFGHCRLRVVATPGHTPESICILVFDSDHGASPWGVLTGDTLFIGDVGRPDLSPTHTPQQLAGMLFDSLHNKLLSLPDDVLVYPAHGAGSLCGRNMRADKNSSIGTERLTNYALQIKGKEEFIQELTSNLPARPEYFARDAEMNREGAAALSELPPLPGLEISEINQILSDDSALLLDVRPGSEFAAGHISGSVNIGLSGQFASWAGALIGHNVPLVLVTDTDAEAMEARTRLARVGIERLLGFVKGGIGSWAESGSPVATIKQVTAQELAAGLKSGELQVLDVRRQSEWEAGHIEGAHFLPLDFFRASVPELDRNMPVAVHCKGGYRSMIAASLLQRSGFTNLVDLTGGFDAWQDAEPPVAKTEGSAVGQ